MKNGTLRAAAAPVVARLAATDSSVLVRAAALTALGGLKEKRYAALYAKALGSPSYRVQAAALLGLLPLDPKQALSRATAFEADSQGPLATAQVAVYGQMGGLAQWPLVRDKYDAAAPPIRFEMLGGLGELLGRLDDPTALEQGIGRIQELAVRYKPYIDTERIIGLLQQVQQQQAARPNAARTRTLVEQAAAAIRAA